MCSIVYLLNSVCSTRTQFVSWVKIVVKQICFYVLLHITFIILKYARTSIWHFAHCMYTDREVGEEGWMRWPGITSKLSIKF